MPDHRARPPLAGALRCRPGWCALPLCMALLAGCAARTAPAPVAPAHPAFVYPAVPPALQGTRAEPGLERGWSYLQSGAHARAGREFETALRLDPLFYPAMAGQGYTALAERQYDQAVEAFDRALRQAAEYVPALVGRGQALLALERDEDAASAFEAAVRADPSLDELRTRAQVLRLRVLQETIARARAAAAAGRLDEARQQYDEALAVSPESAFLHREAAAVARRGGEVDRALTHLRRAADLDPFDAASLVQVGELLDARGEFEAAAEAYQQALAIEPDTAVAARAAAAAERAREAGLPAPYRAIRGSGELTRGALAALLSVRLESLLAGVPRKPAIITDVRAHWAEPWIDGLVSAGVLELFENYTFRPERAVTRAELAEAVRRVALLVRPQTPALTPAAAERPAIADVGPGHLSYPAVSFAVRSELMALSTDGRFVPSGTVPGDEAIDVLARLRALLGDTR